MDELSKIAEKYECEKFTLCDYTKHYDVLFNSLRDIEFNLLEIGVSDGRSMAMWRDYFHKANLYGIDTDPKSMKHLGERTQLHLINQCDEKKITELSENIGNYFIVCDDGSHYGSDMVSSLNTLTPFLLPGGYYIVEDILPEYKEQVYSYIQTLPYQEIFRTCTRFRPEVEMVILQKNGLIRRYN